MGVVNKFRKKILNVVNKLIIASTDKVFKNLRLWTAEQRQINNLLCTKNISNNVKVFDTLTFLLNRKKYFRINKF